MSGTRTDVPLPRPAPRPSLTLRQRSNEAELLDAQAIDSGDLGANLRDLARLNRLPGGVQASADAIARLAGDRPSLRVVDLGTGGADMPLSFAWRGWAATAIDSHPQVAAAARAATAHEPRVEIIEADCRAVPFGDDAFDVAHSSLLLHHLYPPDAITALREMRRVARVGVVVNDVRRGLLAYVLGAPPVLAFSRSAMTRHDGLVSLRRAYTLRELDQMLDDADLRVVWRSNRWMPRVVTAAVPKTSR